MFDRHTTRIVLGFALLVLLCTTSASAFVLLNPPRTWANTPTYRVDNRGLVGVNDGNGGVTATVNAIVSGVSWNGAGSGTIVNAISASVNGFQLGDGIPMLNFRDPINACTGGCLAATFTGFFSGSTITDADIVTNTSHSWTSQGEDPNGNGCNGEFYIEGVMVHEIGHALGLGHTNVGGATMFPSVAGCNNGPASIANDDAAGITTLYGNNDPDPDPDPPGNQNSCDGRCGQQAPGGCWCDEQCAQFGDCCNDKRAECGGAGVTNSCIGSCGLQAPGGCWCDNLCAQFGDCCNNKLNVCGPN